MAEEAFKIAKEWEHRMPPWADAQPQPPQNLDQITQRAIDIFMMSKKPNGEMGGIGWWQTGNGYTAVALRDYWAGSKHNYDMLANIMKQCESHHRGLINEFNDDTLWWGMCCMDMYNIGGDPWFLDIARGIYRHIHSRNSVCAPGQIKFQDRDMEGACFWTTKPDEGQINSISTGLLCELSIRLALADQGGDKMQEKHPHLSKLQSFLGHGQPSNDDYMRTAHCTLGWILRCRYRPRDGVVLDGIRLKKNEACDWTFSYTTGVVIGAAALMYLATQEEKYMILACHMGHRAMRNKAWVEEDKGGILTEHGSYGHGRHDPAKNNDAVGFKSVLLRELCTLYEVIRKTNAGSRIKEAERTANLIKTFVNLNFASQQQRNTNGNGQYGPWWNGPFEMPTSHSQMAALDVMAAVHLVNRM